MSRRQQVLRIRHDGEESQDIQILDDEEPTSSMTAERKRTKPQNTTQAPVQLRKRERAELQRNYRRLETDEASHDRRTADANRNRTRRYNESDAERETRQAGDRERLKKSATKTSRHS
jgi:hypothetical protein